MEDAREITRLLRKMDAGDAVALDELMRVVHDDLEGMARGHLRRQFGAQADEITLEPSALVNESFMRLIRQRNQYDNRGQFFAIATRIMLRVLIDYRRERLAAKRGAGAAHVTLSMDGPAAPTAGHAPMTIDVEGLADALEELDEMSPRRADVTKMRVVWGLTTEETARSLNISPSTVERDWRFARAWLAARVKAPGATGG